MPRKESFCGDLSFIKTDRSNKKVMQSSKSYGRLDAEDRKEMKDSDFGIPETREFPMPDAAHVRAAEAYFRYAPDNKKKELAHRILLKASQYGVTIKSPAILGWAGVGNVPG